MFRFVPSRARAHLLSASIGLLSVNTSTSHALTLDDLTTWTGSGPNRAALVIDWADGSSPAVYGYRFDTSVTGEDMFRDIASDRPELFLKTGGFTFGTFSGRAIFGIGLDRDADGFALTDSTVFTNGIAEVSDSNADGAASSDPDDSYREGWSTAYWGYYTSDGLSPWAFASAGFTDRILSDGDWDGWSYQPGFVGGAPSVAVPEPTSFLAMLLLAGVSLRRRRSI